MTDDLNGAVLSDCGRYRYLLWRTVAADRRKGTCLFVMLNPSTADVWKDDPTIRRCKTFAHREGCGRLEVVSQQTAGAGEAVTTMKAISLWQPWATLMAEKFKRIETRSWPTKHRGDVAIHAAKKVTPEGLALWASEQGVGAIPHYLGPFRELPTGTLLCIVDLIDCVPTDWLLNSHEDVASRYRTEYFSCNGFATGELRYGNYESGRWAWITRNCRTLHERPSVIGRQGLFNVEVAA